MPDLDLYLRDLPDPTGEPFGLLGIEVGSPTSFFSAEHPRLGRLGADSVATLKSRPEGGWRYDAAASLPMARVRVSEEGRATRRGGARSLAVEPTGPTRLMDAVLRFTFPAARVRTARIGEESIVHANRNRYHQRPLAPVILETVRGERLEFDPRIDGLPPGMVPVVYLRDERARWVLHVRAIAATPTYVVLKGCHRWFNEPFPDSVQRVVRRSATMTASLLYVRERLSQRIPLQLNGAVDVPTGAPIRLETRWRWS